MVEALLLNRKYTWRLEGLGTNIEKNGLIKWNYLKRKLFRPQADPKIIKYPPLVQMVQPFLFDRLQIRDDLFGRQFHLFWFGLFGRHAEHRLLTMSLGMLLLNCWILVVAYSYITWSIQKFYRQCWCYFQEARAF